MYEWTLFVWYIYYGYVEYCSIYESIFISLVTNIFIHIHYISGKSCGASMNMTHVTLGPYVAIYHKMVTYEYSSIWPSYEYSS